MDFWNDCTRGVTPLLLCLCTLQKHLSFKYQPAQRACGYKVYKDVITTGIQVSRMVSRKKYFLDEYLTLEYSV
jgi:hypothetical protein